MDYPILKGEQQLGKVQLLKEGLYYRLCCRCRSPGDQMYRLTVTAGEKQENLGILAPMGDGFGLDRKIPVSHMGEGPMVFSVAPAHGPVAGRFVPLSPSEPFSYLDRLKDAYLTKRDGQPGLMLPE